MNEQKYTNKNVIKKPVLWITVVGTVTIINTVLKEKAIIWKKPQHALEFF